MSWSVSTTVKHKDARTKDEIETLSNLAVIGNEQCIKERDEQADVVKQALFVILGDAIFRNADEISISVSGHANKEHEKDDSWSNEFVSINVSVKSYR